MARSTQRRKRKHKEKTTTAPLWLGMLSQYEPRLNEGRGNRTETQLRMIQQALTFGFFSQEQLESLAAYARVILQAAFEVRSQEAKDKAQAIWLAYKDIASRKDKTGKYGVDAECRAVLWDAIEYVSTWARKQSEGTIDRAIDIIESSIVFDAQATCAGRSLI